MGEVVRETAWLLVAFKEHPIMFLVIIVSILLGMSMIFLAPKWLKAWDEHQKAKLENEKESKTYKDREAYAKLEVRLANLEEIVVSNINNPMVSESQFDEFRKEIVSMFEKQNTVLDRMALPVQASVMYNTEASIYDRMFAAYEFFLLGGNHGAENYFVTKILMGETKEVSKDRLKMWYSLKADMQRNGRVPGNKMISDVIDGISTKVN